MCHGGVKKKRTKTKLEEEEKRGSEKKPGQRAEPVQKGKVALKLALPKERPKCRRKSNRKTKSKGEKTKKSATQKGPIEKGIRRKEKTRSGVGARNTLPEMVLITERGPPTSRGKEPPFKREQPFLPIGKRDVG